VLSCAWQAVYSASVSSLPAAELHTYSDKIAKVDKWSFIVGKKKSVFRYKSTSTMNGKINVCCQEQDGYISVSIIRVSAANQSTFADHRLAIDSSSAHSLIHRHSSSFIELLSCKRKSSCKPIDI